MANTLLISGTLQWRNNPLSHIPPSNLRFTPLLSTKVTKPAKLTPKCSSAKPPPNPSTQIKDQKLVGIIADTVLSAVDALKKPALAFVLTGLLMVSDPNSAWAASGGRVGGRAFSSPSPSRSYSTGRASSKFSYTTPYYAPSPFGGGFYAGPAFGFGLGAGSSFLFIFAGFAAFMLVSGFLSDRSEGSVLTATEKTSVLKLQVGLLGMARSLQKDLNRLAETADTSSPEGLNFVLTETMLALLRNPDYCISAYSSTDVKRSVEEGEKRFNQLSIEERGKFNEETLINVNNIKRQSTSGLRASGFRNEYIVVSFLPYITVLVAAEGVHKLPPINASKDLKDALQKLGSIPSTRTMAVEVLWTPQDENDTLSERELLQDYPLLRPL
ncbi:hypothetical protein V2J09_002340 [Rumex salicifolius]